MNFQDHGHALPDNVVMFPGARRPRLQHQSLPVRPAPHRQPAVVSGAELNARLMILLGICVSGAAALISAAHFLQG
ncbi:MAG TPA: hypothetical protein VJ822_04530 [Dongiaceae bacterium]|nr:hypothetical protein [Dongiaceae bacterium]